MDLQKKEQIEARLRDLIKEQNTDNTKPEKRAFLNSTGNVIRRRKGHPTKRIV